MSILSSRKARRKIWGATGQSALTEYLEKWWNLKVFLETISRHRKENNNSRSNQHRFTKGKSYLIHLISFYKWNYQHSQWGSSGCCLSGLQWDLRHCPSWDPHRLPGVLCPFLGLSIQERLWHTGVHEMATKMMSRLEHLCQKAERRKTLQSRGLSGKSCQCELGTERVDLRSF